MKYKNDYETAGVPMLPVVRDQVSVGKQIVWYAYAYVLSTIALVPVATMGWVYAITALVSGLWFIIESHLLLSQAKKNEVAKPMRLFHISITQLTILFIAIGVDPILYFAIN
jgi:protoheme IX farnesyltransferase